MALFITLAARPNHSDIPGVYHHKGLIRTVTMPRINQASALCPFPDYKRSRQAKQPVSQCGKLLAPGQSCCPAHAEEYDRTKEFGGDLTRPLFTDFERAVAALHAAPGNPIRLHKVIIKSHCLCTGIMFLHKKEELDADLAENRASVGAIEGVERAARALMGDYVTSLGGTTHLLTRFERDYAEAMVRVEQELVGDLDAAGRRADDGSGPSAATPSVPTTTTVAALRQVFEGYGARHNPLFDSDARYEAAIEHAPMETD